jgi:GntR family transcriptional regulator
VSPGLDEAGGANDGSAEGIGSTALFIYRILLEQILSGTFRSGQRLGSERELASQLWVSRATLRKALRVLEDDGAIRRIPGRGGGTFVKQIKITRDLSQVVSVPALLESQGVMGGAHVLSAWLGLADEVSQTELHLAENALVFRLTRVRLADGSPISVESAVFPADRFPGIKDQPLDGSMYELLETQYGSLPGEALERIEVVSATRYQAEMLDVAYGAPLLSIVRTTSDQDGIPIEYSHDLFRGDRTRIVVKSPGRGGFTRATRTVSDVVELWAGT